MPPTKLWVGIKICTSPYVRPSVQWPHWFCDAASFTSGMGLCHLVHYSFNWSLKEINSKLLQP